MSVEPYGRRRWRWLLVAGAPLLAVTWFALAPRRVDLWVTNGRPLPIEVRVGATPHRLEPHQTLHLRVPAGYRPLAGPGGVVRADLTASSIGPRRAYVWNVDEQASYWIVARGYGERTDPRPEPFSAPGTVFPLPADFVPTVDEPLPEEVRVKRGQSGAVRRALWTEHYAAAAEPATLQLIVDNTGMADLELQIDGEPKARVAREAIHVVDSLTPGEHTFVALERGPKGAAGRRFEHRVTLGPAAFTPRTFVWAPGNPAPSYALVAQSYGDVDELPPVEPFQAPASWFVLPADVYSVNAFPETLAPPPGAKGAIARSLWTRRAFEDYRLRPKLSKWTEGINPVQMGELGQQLLEKQAAEAEAARLAEVEREREQAEREREHEHEHEHEHELEQAEPGDLDPAELFPPR
ncbi:MAG: hypothetical protein KDD82_01115 [Planctomycetes bacterium]|nr:hypothetical protein [Planctomycetota bacterium]